MRWRLVVIWLLVVTSAASDELPIPSDVLGSYLPPSNSYKSSVPKDSFQHLNLGLPSTPGVVLSPGSSPSAFKDSEELDSGEGGRYDFSNFNFNIPKSVYTEPKEEGHSSSSEEVTSIGKAFAPFRSRGKLPEETVRQTQSKDAFTISKHSLQEEDIVPDENGMVCITAELYYKLKSLAESKIPCTVSGKRKETVEIKPTIELSKPKSIYFTSKVTGESKVTHKQPKKSVTPDQVGYKLPKPSYESQTPLTTFFKPTLASPQKETNFDLDESGEKRGDHFSAGKPQVPSFFSVSKDTTKNDSGYKTHVKTHDTPEIKLGPKKPKPSYSSPEHLKGGTGKTLYSPISVQPKRKPSLKGVPETSEETYTGRFHPSGEVEPKKTTHTGGEFYQSAKSISDGDGRERKPDSHFSIGLTPSSKVKTSEYKTPGSCCQVVKNGQTHPDSVLSLITKSKPFTVHGDSTLKGEAEDTFSTSLFFKTPETKHAYTGSRANIHAKESEAGTGSFTPIKDVHQINKVSKETPYFTNNISQQKVELSKSPHFIQATNDDRSDEDTKPSYKLPEPISTLRSQVQKTKPKISSPENVDIFGSLLKGEEAPRDTGKIFGSVVKSEAHGKSKPTISVSSRKHDSDEEIYQKTSKQPAHGYKLVKEQPRGATKFPPKSTSTSKIPKVTHKTSTFAGGTTYIAPKSSQTLSVDSLPGFKGSQTYEKSSPDTFSSKEIPSISKSPSFTIGKSEHTKETLPITKAKNEYNVEHTFSTHPSTSSEAAKGKHTVTQPHRSGSYDSPSLSPKVHKISGSKSEDSVGSSDFFKIPSASQGSSPQQPGAGSIKSPHKQNPVRKPEVGTKHGIPSGGQASSYPGGVSGTFTKTTPISDKGDDETRYGVGKKVPSVGNQPNRGLGVFSATFSKTPLTSHKDERKHGLDQDYKTPSHGSLPVGLGGILSKTQRPGKVHEKKPGLGGNNEAPSQGNQPGVLSSPFTKTIQPSVKDYNERPVSSEGFKTSIQESQPGRFVNPFLKKTNISSEDKDRIPKLGGSYKAPSQATAPDVFTSTFPQTTQTSKEKDEKKTSLKEGYIAPSSGTRPAKQPETGAGSFLKNNKGSDNDDKPVGIFGSLKDSTHGSQPGHFASTFPKTTDTSYEDDDKTPSIDGKYNAPSQKGVPTSQPGRVTSTFPKSPITSQLGQVTSFPKSPKTSQPGQVTSFPKSPKTSQPGRVTSSFPKSSKTSQLGQVTSSFPKSPKTSQLGQVTSTFSKSPKTSQLGQVTSTFPKSPITSQPGRVTSTFPQSTLTSKSDADKTTGLGDKYRGSSRGQPITQPGRFAGTFSKTKDVAKTDRSKGKDTGRTHPTTSTVSVGSRVSPSSDQSKSGVLSSTPKHKSTKVQEKLKPSEAPRFRGSQPSTASKPQGNEPSADYQSPKATGSLLLADQQKKTYSGEQPVTQPSQSRSFDRPLGTHRGIGKIAAIASGGKRTGGTYSSTRKALPSNQSQKSTSVDPQAGSTDSSGQTASKMKMMMPYDFEWSVNDADTNNDFGQKASSDGMVEKGEYHVVLPDGRKQVVTYLADWETGYHVNVKYEDTKITPQNS